MPTIRSSTFSFSAHDIVQAALDFTQPQRRRHRLILALAIGAALTLIAFPILIVQVFMTEYADWVWGDFLVTLQENAGALGLLAAVILLGAIAQPLLWRYGIWKGLRDNPDQYRDLQVTFNDEGIDFTWPNATLHNDWSFYQTVIESQEYFLLVYGTLYMALPKRAVQDVGALAAMLRHNTASYVDRVRRR